MHSKSTKLVKHIYLGNKEYSRSVVSLSSSLDPRRGDPDGDKVPGNKICITICIKYQEKEERGVTLLRLWGGKWHLCA